MPQPEGKRADPATQFEVDLYILEYLFYMTTKTLLQERQTQQSRAGTVLDKSNCELPLAIVDSFLHSFNTNYPHHRTSSDLQFRLQLLKFTSLLTCRLYHDSLTRASSSLREFRKRNVERATAWLARRSDFPSPHGTSLSSFDNTPSLPPPILSQNRRHVLAQLNVSSSEDFYGTPLCPSLLDVLPSFMALSAARANTTTEWTVTSTWMATAAEFMLQAALEQYLVYGTEGREALLEAFAWGFDEQEVGEDGGEEREINKMFCNENPDEHPAGNEIGGWRQVRAEHFEALMPDNGVPLDDHLKDVATRFPPGPFEAKILTFLEALLTSQPEPMLTQFENGEVEGFSIHETEALKSRLGI